MVIFYFILSNSASIHSYIDSVCYHKTKVTTTNSSNIKLQMVKPSHSHQYQWQCPDTQNTINGHSINRYVLVYKVRDTHIHIVLWLPYRSTCVIWHIQLRSRWFCCSKVLLPTCPCWWQLVHSE